MSLKIVKRKRKWKKIRNFFLWRVWDPRVSYPWSFIVPRDPNSCLRYDFNRGTTERKHCWGYKNHRYSFLERSSYLSPVPLSGRRIFHWMLTKTSDACNYFNDLKNHRGNVQKFGDLFTERENSGKTLVYRDSNLW